MTGRYLKLNPMYIGRWKIRIKGSEEIIGSLNHEWKADEAKVLWIPVAHSPDDRSGLRKIEFQQVADDTLEVEADVPLEIVPSFAYAIKA